MTKYSITTTQTYSFSAIRTGAAIIALTTFSSLLYLPNGKIFNDSLISPHGEDNSFACFKVYSFYRRHSRVHLNHGCLRQ
jgi:hypothetical protein